MTQADANGRFEFCPASDGNYEVVADAPSLSTSNLPSNATITKDVAVSGGIGVNNLAVPLLAEAAPAGSPAFDWAQIEGLVSTQNAASAATIGTATVWALQPFTNDSGDTVQALVPPFVGIDGTLPTPIPPITTSGTPTQANCPDIASVSRPANTGCECFTLAVPASNPVVGSQANWLCDAGTDPGRLRRGRGDNDVLTFDAANRSDEPDSGHRRCPNRGEPDA